MLGNAVWRYVADQLETGAVEVEELDGMSMDAFHIDTLKPEIEVEERPVWAASLSRYG